MDKAAGQGIPDSRERISKDLEVWNGWELSGWKSVNWRVSGDRLARARS